MALLDFVVDATLNDDGGSLKEAVIGNAIYARTPPYDPRIDSTVRVEARRLRSKLHEYYEEEASPGELRISLPTGGYKPIFAWGSDAAEMGGIFRRGTGAVIAVIPFRALSPVAEDAEFADGLTDEIMFTLGAAEGMRVASRGTAFQIKERIVPLVTLAKELGVDAILQGTVRRAGATLRVTVELADTEGFTVWTDRFDAPAVELFDLQERIAATILNRVRLDSSLMRARLIKPGPMALTANARIYKARQLLDRQTPSSMNEALALFTSVAESAPDYARGHAGIADVYCDLFRMGIITHEAALTAASPAAQRALQVDPGSIEAHSAQATISALLEQDYVSAEASYQKALSLGPRARPARLRAMLLIHLERHAEAERCLREARSLEPFSHHQDIAEAIAYYQSRHFGRLEEFESRKPSAELLYYLALARIFSGRAPEAASLAATIGTLSSELPDLAFAQAEIEALVGHTDKAIELGAATYRRASHFASATLALALGQEEQCLAALRKSIEAQEIATMRLRTDIRFDRLRKNPAFIAILHAAP